MWRHLPLVLGKGVTRDEPLSVDFHRVVPQDLALGLVGEGLLHHVGQGLGGGWCVGVGVVGVEDDVVVPDVVHHVLDGGLVGVGGHGALAQEVILRGVLQGMVVEEDGLTALAVLLQAVEPEGDPAGVGLQDEEAEVGEAVQDAAAELRRTKAEG